MGANPNEEPNAKCWEGGDHNANSNLISEAPMPSVKVDFLQVDIIFFFPYVSNWNFMMEWQVYMGDIPCEDNSPQISTKYSLKFSKMCINFTNSNIQVSNCHLMPEIRFYLSTCPFLDFRSQHYLGTSL